MYRMQMLFFFNCRSCPAMHIVASAGIPVSNISDSWFQTFAVFWILSVFFWIFSRRPIVVCRRFGTLYQFHLQGLDVKYEVLEVLDIQSLKMELIECSETSAYCNFNQTPGKYPKEYRQDSKHGESLKSRIRNVTYRDTSTGHNVHRRTRSAVEEEQHLHAIYP